MALSTIVSNIITRLNAVTQGTRNITYSNTVSGLTATTLKGAIDELDGTLDSLNTSTRVLTNKTLDDISNNIGADHIHYKVRNASGSTINVGTVVKADSTQPGTDYIQIVPVTSATDIALGITHTALANNATGLVINTGVQDNYNTSSWVVGTILYPNTSGGFTSTKPTSGQYQACAVVLRQHSSQGTLLVEFSEPKYIASTGQAGYVQLNDTLTSTSTSLALTANQGKVLQDGKANKTDTTYVGTTSIALNRASATQSLTGVSIDGNAGTSTKLATARSLAISGDLTWSVSFDGSANVTATGTLANSGVTAGTYKSVTVDAKGRVTAGTNPTTIASEITNTPAGNISSIDVQSAINELDAEKQELVSDVIVEGISGTPTAIASAWYYNASNSWNSIKFVNNGTMVIVSDVVAARPLIKLYSLSIAYDLSSTITLLNSFSYATTTKQSVTMSSDGMKMYLLQNGNSLVNTFRLTVAWDISTAVIDVPTFSVISSPRDFEFSYDGLTMYVINATNVAQYSLTTAWEPTTGTLTSTISAPANTTRFKLSRDGKFMFIGTNNSAGTADELMKYKLVKTWDISTSLLVSTTTLQDWTVTAWMFNSDYTKMYFYVSVTSGIYTLGSIYQYVLPLKSTKSIGSFEVYGDMKLNGASIGIPSSTTPLMDGTASAGTSNFVAREDHVHPSDTSKVSTTTTVNGHALSGNVTVTASDVGLGSVDNTADSTKNVLSATKLTTARTISGVSFDGSANINIEDRLGTAIASAATTTIGTAGIGDYVHITGTTTITSFGTASAAGIRRTLIFDGALTLTHNATSLICPGAASITTIAGTVIEVVAESTTNWRVVSITHPSVSMTALGYLDASSSIQTQLNAKAPLVSPSFTTPNIGAASGTSLTLSGSVSSPSIAYKATPVTVTAWTYSGTTITLTASGHTASVGDYIEVLGLTTTDTGTTAGIYAPNGVFAVTAQTATTISYVVPVAPTVTNKTATGATVKGYTLVNGRVSESIGSNQTWQNVTSLRALSTTYTNNTGRPIYIDVGLTGGAFLYYTINGTTYGNSVQGHYTQLNIIVPTGATYSAISATGILAFWNELR